MKVGDYVRTPYGIRKVKKIRVKDNYMDDGFYVEDRFIICGHKAMQEVKSSPNIIDLIEVGDYVNGIQITIIENDNKGKYVFGYGADGMEGEMWFYNDNIKSIVTKEQFESMEYRIGD